MIDVVIPTMRRAADLALLLDQIRQTAGYPCRVIVTGTNASAAVNRNLGLSQTNGDRVVMVDDDIEFTADSTGWLRVLADALNRPEVVMVSAQLLNPNGSYAYMTGLQDCGLEPRSSGETVVPSKRLLTACCAFKPHGLRFDEAYIGSGFEDCDYSNQLAAIRPDGVFLVCHDARAIHRNEAKNQRGSYWDRNKARYLAKWGGEIRDE
jgi:glycosyltransferase involved in cell wall biosynthesis